MEVVPFQMPSSTYEPQDQVYKPKKDRDYTCGIYWVPIGESCKVHHTQRIVFEDDILIVNGQNRGKALDPSNQSFLQSLERYELPREFDEDGTHMVVILRCGDTGPVQFNSRYFENIPEDYEFDCGIEDAYYESDTVYTSDEDDK